MSRPKRILAIATCHNRRNKTLAAIDSLARQDGLSRIELDVAIVDDGSSDGTSPAIKQRYPWVKITRGTGDLYWAGGMRYALARFWDPRAYDYLLVFNDDIQLSSGALHRLLATYRISRHLDSQDTVVVGAFLDPATERTSYSGLRRRKGIVPLRFRKVVPTDVPQYCDTLNMNAALIPSALLSSIGFLSPEYKHAKADIDFGLRVAKFGGNILLAPGYVGYCEGAQGIPGSLDSSSRFRDRARSLVGVKEEPLYDRLVFCRRHGGVLWPGVFMIPYARFVFNELAKTISRLLRGTSTGAK